MIRANMADMLTYKEVQMKTQRAKDVEKSVVLNTTMHAKLEDREGTLFFDGSFKKIINKGSVRYVFFNKEGT